MTPQEIEAQLARSLEDYRLSRAERQDLREAFQAIEGEEARADIRHRAFQLFRTALPDEVAGELVDWLEEVVKTLHPIASSSPAIDPAEAWFSPMQDCARRIVQLLGETRRTLDICVFTITDDRISEAILAAHKRGVAVRVLTDDEKAEDLGSDIERLEGSGIGLRTDRSPSHMHHKFALFDGSRLLTGSYNWTRSASRENQENFLVTSEPRLVAAFARAFEGLWQRLGT